MLCIFTACRIKDNVCVFVALLSASFLIHYKYTKELCDICGFINISVLLRLSFLCGLLAKTAASQRGSNSPYSMDY